jgi:hypothetical protein
VSKNDVSTPLAPEVQYATASDLPRREISYADPKFVLSCLEVPTWSLTMEGSGDMVFEAKEREYIRFKPTGEAFVRGEKVATGNKDIYEMVRLWFLSVAKPDHVLVHKDFLGDVSTVIELMEVGTDDDKKEWFDAKWALKGHIMATAGVSAPLDPPYFFSKTVNEVIDNAKEAALGRQLVEVLLPHAGEAGQSEGAIEVLERLIGEVKAAREAKHAAKGGISGGSGGSWPYDRAQPGFVSYSIGATVTGRLSAREPHPDPMRPFEVRCPAHEDKGYNCLVDKQRGKFHCPVCNTRGILGEGYYGKLVEQASKEFKMPSVDIDFSSLEKRAAEQALHFLKSNDPRDVKAKKDHGLLHKMCKLCLSEYPASSEHECSPYALDGKTEGVTLTVEQEREYLTDEAIMHLKDGNVLGAERAIDSLKYLAGLVSTAAGGR